MSFSISDLFWVFFIIIALQPMIRQWIVNSARTRKIMQIESERGSRVILLVHRQETMRLLGFPILRYIDINDSEEVLRAIQMTGDDVPLDIILHTPGGLVLAALQIARAIGDHKAKVTVFVPHYAMSGGTASHVVDLCAAAGPQDKLFFITGADALAMMLTWHDVDELFTLAHFVGCTRPGHRLSGAGLPDGKVSLVEIPALAISSTECRARVEADEPVWYLVPDGVVQYIAKRGLYAKHGEAPPANG